MKALMLCFAATLQAVAAGPDNPYRTVTAQAFAIEEAYGCDAVPARRLGVAQALAFYDGLTKICATLHERLWNLDVTLMELAAAPPASPLDERMRSLRANLAERLAAVYHRTRNPGEGAARQADLLEMARLTGLIHLVDMEIAEAANRKLADSKDTRVAAALQALRRVEARADRSARQAAAMVEAIRQTARRRLP